MDTVPVSVPTPAEHTTEVLETWSPTPATRAIRLRRPPGFAFETSQAVRLILPRGMRPLSIASGPTRPHLDLAVRRSESEFKQDFFALKPGDPVRLVGPRGSFLLDRARPAVMIAGGIGITPFRSMLQTVVDERIATPIRLLWSNREAAPFRDEIDALAAAAPDVSVTHTDGRLGSE